MHCFTASFMVAIFFLLSFRNSFWKVSKLQTRYLKIFCNPDKNGKLKRPF